MVITKAGKTNRACGSALLSFLSRAFSPLFNQRGEVVISDPSAGAGDGGGELDPAAGGSQSQDGTAGGGQDDFPDVGASPAGAQNTDQNAQATEGLDGQQAEADPPFHTHPRWIELNKKNKELAEKTSSYEAQLTQASEIATFYQNKFNEHLRAQQAMRGQQPGAQRPGQQPAPAGMPGAQQPPGGFKLELPQNIKGPGKWETQEDEAAYLDHVTNHIVNNQVPQVAMQATKQVFDQVVMPIVEQITSVMQDLQEAHARTSHPDYDDMIKAANEAIFTLGPDGKVFGVKNPALLSYIKSQKNPYLALYNHGLTIKAPNKIKAGVDKATRNALRTIGAKPSGPTRPASSNQMGQEAQLDWDTPPKQAEQVLSKRGLL